MIAHTHTERTLKYFSSLTLREGAWEIEYSCQESLWLMWHHLQEQSSFNCLASQTRKVSLDLEEGHCDFQTLKEFPFNFHFSLLLEYRLVPFLLHLLWILWNIPFFPESSLHCQTSHFVNLSFKLCWDGRIVFRPNLTLGLNVPKLTSLSREKKTGPDREERHNTDHTIA